MDFGTIKLEDLKKGHHFDSVEEVYRCNHCGVAFSVGQVFPIDDGFYDARHAADIHVEETHGGNFNHLLTSENKYNTLTDVQKDLLALFHEGQSDKEIAHRLGISASTVRHQKFTFREKAKKAKMYLALYEQALEDASSDENAIVPIHNTATMVDSRYVTTEKEKAQILKNTFISFSPLRLGTFPFKPKKHLVVLTRIAEEFEQGRMYTEKETKELLGSIYEDYSLLRRLLVDYGFMDRTDDGARYWLR